MKTIISSVAFTDPQSNIAANGVLTLDLSQAWEVTAGGGQVANKRVTITLTAAGVIPASTSIFANDELTPAQTSYHAQLFDASGNRLADFGQWSIVGASPIDVSKIAPTTSGASYPAAVLQQPSSQQKITGFPLELGSSLILDGSISGSTTLQAATNAGGVATLPNNTGTVAETNLGQTWSAPQTFNSGDMVLAGATSGSVTLQPVAVAGANTATLPANTGTIAELNLAQTWTAAQTFSSGILGPGFKQQIFNSSGTFTIPTGITQVKVTVVGGGGAGGGGTSGGSNGYGGGSGGCSIKWLTGLTPGNTLNVTVGAGGAGVSGGSGGNGNASSVSTGTQSITTILANGAPGGGPGNGVGNGGASGSGGDVNFGGNPGLADNSAGNSGAGAGSIFGGAGPPTGASNVNGNSGMAPGAGGSGGHGGASNTSGGAGANGIVIFEWLN